MSETINVPVSWYEKAVKAIGEPKEDREYGMETTVCPFCGSSRLIATKPSDHETCLHSELPRKGCLDCNKWLSNIKLVRNMCR